MIGKYQVQIGADQLITGLASSDYAQDGTLGTSSFHINPFIAGKGGTIWGTQAGLNKSTNLVDDVIASIEDSQFLSVQNRLLVDRSANFYWYTGTVLAKKHTGIKTYTQTRTDMANVALKTYTSSNDDIARWITSSDTFDETWWTGTATVVAGTHPAALDGTVPHPMLTYENPVNTGSALWIADKNQLHFYDPIGDHVYVGQLVLNTNDAIQALGIDPATGLMLISVQTAQNASDTLGAKYNVLLYDGFSSKVRRKVPMNDLVLSFRSVGGTVFCGFDSAIGTWNGNGITFLRRLVGVEGNSLLLPYKHLTGEWNNLYLVAQGAQLLAFGEISSSRPKAWFPLITTGAGNITAVSPVGGSNIGLGYASNKFYVWDIQGTGAPDSAVLYLNNIYFPRPIFLRRIRVFTTGVANAGQIIMTCYDESATTLPISNAARIINPTATTYKFDFDFGNAKAAAVQPAITIGNNSSNFGVVGLIIYYDIAE